MKAKIYITLKKSVLDPQGQAIEHSLHNIGFTEISKVRQGKLIELQLETTLQSEAEQQVQQICDKLLVNKVIEDYKFELLPA